MDTWMKVLFVCMGVLVFLIFIFGYLSFYTQSKNDKREEMKVLYPFSGYLSPSGLWNANKNPNNPGQGATPEEGLYLTGMVGGKNPNTPQIQCPVGHKINIVSAYLEVIDPYGECSNNPDDTLQRTCGNNEAPNLALKCNDKTNPCGQGMVCNSGICEMKTCSTNKDCSGNDENIPSCNSELGKSCFPGSQDPEGLLCVQDPKNPDKYVYISDPTKGSCMACVNPDTNEPPKTGESGFCSFMPTCSFVEVKTGMNETCSPSSEKTKDKYKCRPRDSSAYLSEYCNGKRVCLGSPEETWFPNDPSNNPFGPLPCRIKASSDEDIYASLPITSGWGGGTPALSKNSIDDLPNFNQGYKVSGLYGCYPED